METQLNLNGQQLTGSATAELAFLAIYTAGSCSCLMALWKKCCTCSKGPSRGDSPTRSAFDMSFPGLPARCSWPFGPREGFPRLPVGRGQAEILVRLVAQQCACFWDGWFIFDLVLVISACMEQVSMATFRGEPENELFVATPHFLDI